jgi:dTDP-4-amino-4,6-dideoxygalactose transaminase
MSEDGQIAPADPRANYLAHKREIDRAMARVLDGGRYILGPEVEVFEKSFASYLGARHAVGVASGTDALVLALRALGVGADDYVATVAHSAVATVAAIELAGAKPLLVDIEPGTMTLDPAALARALRSPPGRVAAILPVHLYGQAADLDAIVALARRVGARVVEDCAQAHGARLGGVRLGTIGDIAAFSFYPTKNLGGIGDGGAVVTGDAALALRVAELREYGWRERYVSAVPGMNSRLDPLQAAVLGAKLPHLDAENDARAALAAHYDARLAGAALDLPARRENATHVFHQYVVRHAARDALRARLDEAHVGTLVHYPVPVHLQEAYCGRLAIGEGGLGQSERAARTVLSLPIFPELSRARADGVSDAIVQALSSPKG